jgi:hypothetical protein
MLEDTSSASDSDEDGRRRRELSQYFLPDQLQPQDGPPINFENGFSQDVFSALQPYCQLVGLASGASKVMLNFMDHETMYFIADYDGVEGNVDPIVTACSAAVPMHGRVCEMTIRMKSDNKSDNNVVPMFTVPDLTQSVFKDLGVVKGPPYFRFYAGTPITTSAGINIGSLAILDDKPRDGLTPALERLLGRTAQQVMDTLETRRLAADGRRAALFLRSSEALTSGKSSVFTQTEPATSYGIPVTAHRPGQPKERSGSVVSIPGVADEDVEDELSRSEDDPDRIKADFSGPATFERAAGLLRESFDQLDMGVEVVFAFLDVSRHRMGSHDQPVSFIASPPEKSDSVKLPDTLIKSLVRRYPKGCLFDLEESLCYSPIDPNKTGWLSVKRPSRPTASQLDRIDALREAFPGASQVLFTSLWDPDRGSFAAAAFIANMSNQFALSVSTDLSFLNSFGCSLMVECSRIDAAKSSQQKSDFSSTISHELRSPLHGILASVEFLSDTQLDSHQESLVSTVQSCGKVLLDTINHVLDYSKINTYRKAWQAENTRTFALKGRKAPPIAPPPLLPMTEVTEVANIVEEVVETLVTSQEFSDKHGSSLRSNGHAQSRLQVFLDIDPGDYIFSTQPGASTYPLKSYSDQRPVSRFWFLTHVHADTYNSSSYSHESHRECLKVHIEWQCHHWLAPGGL